MSMQSKSGELDVMLTPLLKQLINKCIHHIMKIFNISLTQGVFSMKWKTSIVRPLLKKAGLVLINKNYRPVSNLSFLSKLVEHCALDQFNCHCDNLGLIPDFQFAYQSAYSTETSLLKLSNDILWGMERQEITAVLLLDSSVVFNTVDHNLLLSTLENQYGITDQALDWYKSYLSPHQMKVCVNAHYSEILNIKYGVPQGSCSKANNIATYCAPIEGVISDKSVGLRGYADDHSIRKSFKPSTPNTESETMLTLKNSVSEIADWIAEMRLKLNQDKTELILFGLRRQLLKCNTTGIELNGNLITLSNKVRYLGGNLDCQLNFKKHTGQVCGKAMANFFQIWNTRKFLNKSTAETLLLGLCKSHLDYANAMMYGLPDVDINRVQRVQSMCAKLVLNHNPYSSTTDALKTLHWIPIKSRIVFKLVCIVHKCQYGNAPKTTSNQKPPN